MSIKQTSKLGEPIPQRIVILRALHLGNLLCTVPAFRAIRAALPHATISLIGLPWSREFVKRFSHYLDDFIEFPGFPGFPERTPRIEHIPAFLTQVQQLGFDLAIQMQGSGWNSNTLLMVFGAIYNTGFYVPGEYCPDENRFLEYPSREPEVVRHLKLMEFLDIPSQGDYLEFPLYPKDWEQFHALEKKHGLESGNFVCIHAGARALERRWPTNRFAAIADGLAQRGLQIVLTGVQRESNLTAAVASHMKFPSIDLAGQTSLGSLGALISAARLIVCNDTGVSHIAAAFRKPSIVLFSASDPVRWAPINRSLHRIIAPTQSVSSQSFMETAEELLRETSVHPG